MANKKQTKQEFPQYQYGVWEDAGTDEAFFSTRNTLDECVENDNVTTAVAVYKLERVVFATRTSKLEVK